MNLISFLVTEYTQCVKPMLFDGTNKAYICNYNNGYGALSSPSDTLTQMWICIYDYWCGLQYEKTVCLTTCPTAFNNVKLVLYKRYCLFSLMREKGFLIEMSAK